MVRWMVVMMMGVMRMVWRHHRLGVGLRRVWRQPRQGRHRHAKVWPAHLAARHPGGVRSGSGRVVSRMHLSGVMMDLLVILLACALLRRAVVSTGRGGRSGRIQTDREKHILHFLLFLLLLLLQTSASVGPTVLLVVAGLRSGQFVPRTLIDRVHLHGGRRTQTNDSKFAYNFKPKYDHYDEWRVTNKIKSPQI